VTILRRHVLPLRKLHADRARCLARRTVRSFKIETRHTERGIAHELEAEFLRRSKLGAHDEVETGAKCMGFSLIEASTDSEWVARCPEALGVTV
jgi:hypothetical protein